MAYGRMTKVEYPQENTAKLIKQEKISRELKSLKKGFYLLIYKKPEDAIYKSNIMKIIAMDKKTKKVKVVRFYGPDRILQEKKEGEARTWHDKKYIKEFPNCDLRYLGITIDPIESSPDDIASRYYPIHLNTNGIKQAIRKANIITKKLDIPFM